MMVTTVPVKKMTKLKGKNMETKNFSGVINDTATELKKIEAYKNKPISELPQKLGFFALVAFGLFMASMFVFHIFVGMVALVMVAVTGVLMWAGWAYVKRLDPLLQQKARNGILKRRIEEARRNAIYQLDNQVIDRHKKLKEAQIARDKMGALVLSMKDKIANGDAESATVKKMVAILSNIEKAYEAVKVNLDKAKDANQEFEQKVKEYKDLEAFSNIAGEAMAMFAENGDSKLQEMLSLESFSAIDTNFNSAIIAIENSSRDMSF